jgi:hypothetical protein
VEDDDDDHWSNTMQIAWAQFGDSFV